jgi:tetratricopeptide (TPR) repeat protein
MAAAVDFASATDDRFTLHYAAKMGNLERVEQLLSRDIASVVANARDRESGWSALHFAARYGQAEVAKCLLQHGGDPNLRDDTGCTALHLGAAWGNADTLYALLEYGADKTMTNTRDLSAQDFARELGRADLAAIVERWDTYAMGGTQADRAEMAAELAAAKHPAAVAAEGESATIFGQLQALAMKERAMGANHIGLSYTLSKLAVAYRAEGRLGDVEAVLRRLAALVESQRGLEHTERAAALSQLGEVVHLRGGEGASAEAAVMFEQALEIMVAKKGDAHEDTVCCLENLGVCYHALGRYAEAEPLLLRSLRAQEAMYEPYPGAQEHVGLVRVLNLLGGLALGRGAHEDGHGYYARALHQVVHTHGDQHMACAQCFDNMAKARYHQGPTGWAEAEVLFNKSLATWQRHHPEDKASLMRCQNNLAFVAALRHNAKADMAALQGAASAGSRKKPGGKKKAKKR